MVNHEVLIKDVFFFPLGSIKLLFWGGGLKLYFAKHHYLEDLGVDGRVVLKMVLEENRTRESWTGSIRDVAGSCEHASESLGSVNCRGFLD